MKKIITILLILIMVSVSVFAVVATTEPIEYSGVTDFAYMPTSSRVNAMGGATNGVGKAYEALFNNPADLAGKTFGIRIPAVSMTVYNASALLSDSDNLDYISGLANGEDLDSNFLELAMNMLSYTGSDRGALMATDVSMGMNIGQLGVGLDSQVKLHSWNPDGGGTTSYIVPEVNVAASLGTGVYLVRTPTFSLSAGVSAHFANKFYFEGQDLTSIINLADEESENTFESVPVMGGYAFPIEAGVNMGFMDDQLKVSFVANNLNGNYHMKSYAGYGYMLSDLGLSDEYVISDDDFSEFDIVVSPEYSAGISFVPDWNVLQPVVSVNLTDIEGFITDMGEEDPDYTTLFAEHTKAGVEVNLLKHFNVRGGLNQGYMSVGAGFDLFILRVEADYNWQEYGVALGDKPVDSVTFRVNLGID